MNLLFVLGDDGYLHVRYYPVFSKAHPRCLGATQQKAPRHPGRAPHNP